MWRCWFTVWINFSLGVTKGFSGFLVKTVVSASDSLRLSGLSHGKFYFYYPLQLTRAGALAILTGSLPPVCHLLHRFFGSWGIWPGCHPVNPYSVYFPTDSPSSDYKYWLLCHLSMVWCACPIALNQPPIGHQYSRQQLYSKRINWLFSIGGGNSSASLWVTQAFWSFPREVLFLLSPKTHQSLTKLTLKPAYSNAEILNLYLYSATPTMFFVNA